MQHRSKINYLWILFWVATVLFVFYYYSVHLLSPDEGFVLNAAWQLWDGKKMYVDFFEYIAPGSAYSVYFVWKIFGQPTYLTAKIFSILFWLFSAIGVYGIFKKVFNNKLAAALGIVLWLFACRLHPLINHNIYSSYVAVWFTYALILYVQARPDKKVYYLLLAGALSALTAVFLQTKGIFMFGSGLAVLFLVEKNSWKNKFMNMAIYSSSFIALLAILFFQWNINTIYYSLFVFLREGGYMNHTYIVPFIIVEEVIICVLMLYVAWKKQNLNYWVLGIVQSALFLSCINLIDQTHFMVNAFPFWIFLAIAGFKLLSRFKITGFEFYFILTAIFLPIILILALVADHFTPESLWEKNMYVVDILGKNREYVFKIPEIQQAKYIYSGFFYPGMYFEFKKPNPFPYSNLLLCPEKCQQVMVKTLKEAKPEFAFLVYQNYKLLDYDRNNPVDLYIRKYYRYCKELSALNFHIFARDSCPPLPADVKIPTPPNEL